MIAAVLCALAAVATPQDTGMLDVPIYRNAAYGVALPRPFADWVFSAGGSPRTITVLFHPRQSLLREQLWGALVLTSFDGPVPLGAVADQRIEGTWQREFGPSFRLLTRDSVIVAGLPAIHLVMAGAVNRVAVDVEEYAIARGRDLVVLQFRYPRGLPRDSIAAGYEVALAGLSIRPGAGSPTAATTEGLEREEARDVGTNRAIAGSPWRTKAIEARVRVDSSSGTASVAARLEAVNEDVRARDTLVVAVRAPLAIDSVRGATGRAFVGASGPLVSLRLLQPVEALAATAVTVFYRLPEVGRAVAPGAPAAASRQVVNWLPIVEPVVDSAGSVLPQRTVRRSIRFDVPLTFAAVTAGRLVVDFTANGRRQMAWVTDDETADASGFVVGALRRVVLRPGPLVSIRVWLDASAGATASEGRAGEIAELVREAWTFYTVAFGRVAYADAEVVLGDGGPPPVAGATLFLSPFVTREGVREAVARVWWGQSVRFAGRGAEWLQRALPPWSALALTASLEGDSVRQRAVREAEARGGAVAALEAARRAVGDARFRAVVREFFLNHRASNATLADLRAVIGFEGSQALPSSSERQ